MLSRVGRGILAGRPAPAGPPLLQIVAMLRCLVNLIPSQANCAAEQMRNTLPSVIGGATSMGLTLFAMRVNWDLVGFAAALIQIDDSRSPPGYQMVQPSNLLRPLG